ncbi:MAG: 16S rRNA (guanine(966)-N(2))-methyltransferase RsmD [Acidobacteria bacterium]|nr:16S rRNA (guanine(966)-N(2))-methyltransferase RsmD [Acidobacteriota bacterium]MBA3885776.1 16S rRNA (guanine(966)-N(2))-methyltransferase RsmD [Acidobacteriota bacterium]
MRIIAGRLKGRRLEAPDWAGLRPTSDKLRETLFNVLAPRMDGARVLDGYAGTGAVGIEAISRGAAHVTFVERDPRAVRLIEGNLERCGVRRPPSGSHTPDGPYAIIRAGFVPAAERLAGAAFDVIFLDPPYGAEELTTALDRAAPLVRSGTLLVLEHARRDATPGACGGLARTRELVSGDSALAFYSLVE